MATSLGSRIRQARVDAGLGREDVAVALGVSMATVVRWEKNRSAPTLNTLGLIAALLETTASDLLADEVAA